MLILLFFLMSLGIFRQLSFSGTHYNLMFAELFLLSIALFTIFKILKKKQIHSEKMYNKYYILSIILMMYSLLTYFWSPFQSSSLLAVIIYIYTILSILIISNNKISLSQYIVANRILLLSIFTQLIFNFFRTGFSGITNYYTLKSLATTLMGNSNYLSMFIGFILVFEFISKEKLWVLFSLVGVFSLLLTMSKSAILAVSMVLTIYVLIELFNSPKKTTRNKFTIIISFTLITTLLIYLLFKTQIGQVFYTALRGSLTTGYISGRDVLSSKALKNIQNNIFGLGYSIVDDPHNFILLSLRSFGLLFGVLASLFYFLPLFNIFGKKFRNFSTSTKGLVFAYICLLLHSIFEIFFFTNVPTIWVTVTLLFLEREIRNERNDYSKLQ
ncbi:MULTISPECIES: hypothetical protein [Enterococcus]|uniref:hypothetical protein n=1 Tax=Enterococcus TaxID=1350 RepID=UPI00188352F7|nr:MULTISPECIES: hypothetical protein [Enterococcus]EGP5243883.1 hypothetical protein [Enterococcus faecium]MBE9891569.1 hypothetical protein [Enterococcus faecium]